MSTEVSSLGTKSPSVTHVEMVFEDRDDYKPDVKPEEKH